MSRASQFRDRVRVRPNAHTLAAGAIVLVMAYAGAVQGNGAAYLLAFLSASLAAFSFIHARANVRGLDIQSRKFGVISGEDYAPIIIRAGSRQTACGLEVVAEGAKRCALIEKIESGATEEVRVPLAAIARPGRQSMKLRIRSAYPMGLFFAERWVELDCHRRVPLKARGNLPLPEPAAGAKPAETNAASHAQAISREGDDFAGLREWQRGDSLRHIDWRAVARGRPLMVRSWSGGARTGVSLAWDEVPLPEDQRAGQLAKWIEECERQGRPYSLKLPNKEVASGLGPAHAQRCLNAVADYSAGRAANPEEKQTRREHTPGFERGGHLPRGPLAMLCAGIALAVLPLAQVVSPVSLVVLAFCLAWRLRAGLPRNRQWLPPVTAAVGIGALALYHGNILATEVGIGVLVVLQGCKLLEARSPHDFQVLALVAWFMCLCGLLAEQGLGQSLYSLLVFAFISVCMIRFRRSARGMGPPLRLGGVMLAQALPLALLLFIVFPRGSLEEWARRLGVGKTSTTGVPTDLDPGAISKLAMSEASAFRVKFVQGGMPPVPQRYWRCVVLWESQGMSWKRGAPLPLAPRRTPLVDTDFRQEIDMEPHGQLWLPALDRPLSGRSDISPLPLEFDETLANRDVLRRPARYFVASRLTPSGGALPEAHRRAALQVPEDLPANLKAVAARWRETGRNNTEVTQAALIYLRDQRFSYTLDPGQFVGPGAFEEFWFQRRSGFCGHYSAALGTLLRAAGVPTRVVMGYLGGTWNDGGGYLLIRQCDAHAWLEVWLENSGWTRVDPTAVLAPSRLNLDLRGSLLGDEDALNRQRSSLWWRAWQESRLAWDHLNYQWNTHIIRFDEDAQREWLARLGFERLSRDQWRVPVLAAVSAGIAVVGFLLLWLWLRRSAPQSDPWLRAWRRLGRRLVKLGVPASTPSEGPLAYAGRIAAAAPNLAPRVRALAEMYARARYGGEARPVSDFYRGLRELKRH